MLVGPCSGARHPLYTPESTPKQEEEKRVGGAGPGDGFGDRAPLALLARDGGAARDAGQSKLSGWSHTSARSVASQPYIRICGASPSTP
jgi:hypothetical protein